MNEPVETLTFNLDNPRTRSQLLAMVVLPTALQWLAMSVLFVYIGFVFGRWVYPEHRALFTIVCLVGAPGYLALTFGLRAYKLMKTTMERMRKIPGVSMLRCKFYGDRFEFSSDAGSEAKVPYTMIFRLNPEEKGIMILVERARVIWVPAEAFASSDDFARAKRYCSDAQLAKVQTNQLRGL